MARFLVDHGILVARLPNEVPVTKLNAVP